MDEHTPKGYDYQIEYKGYSIIPVTENKVPN
jgi:hypothetical protein